MVHTTSSCWSPTLPNLKLSHPSHSKRQPQSQRRRPFAWLSASICLCNPWCHYAFMMHCRRQLVMCLQPCGASRVPHPRRLKRLNRQRLLCLCSSPRCYRSHLGHGQICSSLNRGITHVRSSRLRDQPWQKLPPTPSKALSESRAVAVSSLVTLNAMVQRSMRASLGLMMRDYSNCSVYSESASRAF